MKITLAIAFAVATTVAFAQTPPATRDMERNPTYHQRAGGKADPVKANTSTKDMERNPGAHARDAKPTNSQLVTQPPSTAPDTSRLPQK